MAATVGTTGFGTLFKRGNGSTVETFTTVAEVRSISGPSLSLETVDATHMESPTGFREILPTFKSGGEVTLEVNFLPATASQTGIKTDFDNKTKRNWRIVFPDTGTTEWRFAGYVTGFSPNATVDGMLSASITITVTAGITVS